MDGKTEKALQEFNRKWDQYVKSFQDMAPAFDNLAKAMKEFTERYAELVKKVNNKRD